MSDRLRHRLLVATTLLCAAPLFLGGCYSRVVRAEGFTAKDQYEVYEPNDGPLIEKPEKERSERPRSGSSGIW